MPNGLADNLIANDTIEIETLVVVQAIKELICRIDSADFTFRCCNEALSYCGVWVLL